MRRPSRLWKRPTWIDFEAIRSLVNEDSEELEESVATQQGTTERFVAKPDSGRPSQRLRRRAQLQFHRRWAVGGQLACRRLYGSNQTTSQVQTDTFRDISREQGLIGAKIQPSSHDVPSLRPCDE